MFFLSVTRDNLSCSFSDGVQIAPLPRMGRLTISDTLSQKQLNSLIEFDFEQHEWELVIAKQNCQAAVY